MKNSVPAWCPDEKTKNEANITSFISELKFTDIKQLHAFSTNQFEKFWQLVIEKLGIVLTKKPEKICDLSLGLEKPLWLKGAKLNIAESCFTASTHKTALIFKKENHITTMTYGELNSLSNQIANSLVAQGFKEDDAIAIDLPMNEYAVAIYLGIIKMGGIVVSIADSFSAPEIATRLQIANTKLIFTQDFILRGGKKIPLYEKIISANAPPAIVFCDKNCTLRNKDISWKNFLIDNKNFAVVPRDPMSPCNILFSSGTTGIPKAIPWNHTTAIKSASDAYFHHNIQENDIVAWPTNLGWMMGPWLIFATLINKASIALYDDVPRERAFGEFVENAKVTMLGVVPTLVAYWRQTRCMEKLNWQHIKRFSSTGECSNPDDMLYLMQLAGNKPVIEYCGGTEIGGGFLSSTMIQNNFPSEFTTPAMGSNFILIDENGEETDNGEVALIPPAMGLSTELLNADHHQIYYEDMPHSNNKILRRHGDQAKRLPNGNYVMLGRVDDTMNLGAIKVSSAEIERALTSIPHIIETAAISVPPKEGGPDRLIIFAVGDMTLKSDILQIMQKKINENLNPLFKIAEVHFIDALPRTASNKIMRRLLRTEFLSTLTPR